MVRKRVHVKGYITVKLPCDDWIWLCELLAEIRAAVSDEEYCDLDIEHALNTLQCFEAGE